MKTFKQFVAELFDTKLPYQSKGVLNPKRGPHDSEIHGYSFTVPSKKDEKPTNIDVHIHHDRNKVGRVVFYDRGSTEKTGKMGTRSPQVISAVANIAREHADKHKLSGISYSSSREDTSRDSLYDALARKHGGGEAPPNEQGITQKFYKIPRKSR